MSSKGINVEEVLGEDDVEDTVIGDVADMIEQLIAILGMPGDHLNTIQTCPNSPSLPPCLSGVIIRSTRLFLLL